MVNGTQETSVDISIITPVYNEAESLPHLYSRLTSVLKTMQRSYEIIFVDDGSKDSSRNVVKSFIELDPHVILVEQRTNFGKSVALNTGFSIAQGEFVITMDADLQDQPEEIMKLLDKMQEGFDLVTGLRVNRWENDPFSKTIPSRVANTLTRVVTGVPLFDMNSGFKCYRRELISRIRLHSDLHRYIPVLAHYQGFRITEVPVIQDRRKYGRSKYGPSRFIRSLFDLLTVMFLSRFRYRPLHLFGSVGVAIGAIGFFILLYLATLWVFTPEPIGDRPLLMLGVLLVVVGIQVTSIGLIADLVVSIDRLKEDPQTTVRNIYGRVRSDSPEQEVD
jgi:glycosyltransferase involved in cell wall biosynthesis